MIGKLITDPICGPLDVVKLTINVFELRIQRPCDSGVEISSIWNEELAQPVCVCAAE